MGDGTVGDWAGGHSGSCAASPVMPSHPVRLCFGAESGVRCRRSSCTWSTRCGRGWRIDGTGAVGRCGREQCGRVAAHLGGGGRQAEQRPYLGRRRSRKGDGRANGVQVGWPRPLSRDGVIPHMGRIFPFSDDSIPHVFQPNIIKSEIDLSHPILSHP